MLIEPEKKRKVVFTLGVFDLFHQGHLNLLDKASKLGDILIVGVVSDRAVRELKGDNRPIVPLAERIAIVDSLRFVNRTIVCESFNPFREIRDMSQVNSINIDIIVKGEDQQHIDYSKVIEKFNPIIVILERTKNLSTSERLKSLNIEANTNVNNI